RPKPLVGGLHRRVAERASLVPELAGELDDEDRVLRREADHYQQADLEVHVARLAAEPHAEEGTEGAERNAEQHGERDRPALILRRQHQEHHDEAEQQNQAALPARDALLIRLAAEGIAHPAGGESRVGEPPYSAEHLPGAVARLGLAG